MKIGVLSDTHDNVAAIQSALREFRARGVELVLHCGDIESPETVRQFADIPTHFVLGNCDWQPDRITPIITEVGGKLYVRFGKLELAGKQVAWVHGHELKVFVGLELSDQFDFLFYGHTHKAEQHRRGRTLVVNPGALFRVRQRSSVVLELPSGELESVVLV